VDSSAFHSEAIRWASRNGNLPVVDRLLQDPRVDPSPFSFKPFASPAVTATISLSIGCCEMVRVNPTTDDNAGQPRWPFACRRLPATRCACWPRGWRQLFASNLKEENPSVADRLLQDPE